MKNQLFIFCGDFNFNILGISPAANCKSNEFHNTFLSHAFNPLIVDLPTRVNNVTGTYTLIDNIYTNHTNHLENCQGAILKTTFSDHYSIIAISKFSFTTKQSTLISRREFTDKNKYKLLKKLQLQNWDYIYNTSSVDDAFGFFHNQIRYIFEECFPEKQVEIKYSNRLPWITKCIRNSIDHKNKLHAIYSKNPSLENNLNYTKYRNNFTSILRVGERNYYAEQIEINKHDLKKSWKIIKEIIGKNNSRGNRRTEYNIKGVLTNDSHIISNEFNKYFTNIGPEFAKDLPIVGNPLNYVNICQNSIFVPYITENEVKNVISGLKNSSPGWDDIPPSILKINVDSYITPLTHLINKSISDGVFPNSLKLAKVIQIFKSGDKSLISNYRPISIEKIEKIMYNHLIDFIDSQHILYKFQFGFRKHFSTSHAIISLVEKIRGVLTSGKFMISVFLDLKKAFDTVNHEILIKKLFAYGVRGNILNWFRSYLDHRKQFVFLDNNKSQTKVITCGVPQGSVLGPLSFIMYINDLNNVSNEIFSILFADDTSVFIEGDNIESAIEILNSELEKISTWLTENKLTLNVSKSHFMIFHRARIKTDSIKIALGKSRIKQVPFTKFLGVIIDDKLNFDNHISYIKNKISKGLGILIKAKKT